MLLVDNVGIIVNDLEQPVGGSLIFRHAPDLVGELGPHVIVVKDGMMDLYHKRTGSHVHCPISVVCRGRSRQVRRCAVVADESEVRNLVVVATPSKSKGRWQANAAALIQIKGKEVMGKRHAFLQGALRLNSLAAALLTTLVLAVVSLTRKSGVWVDTSMMQMKSGVLLDQCNLFSGRWVFDNVSYPLYSERQCTYMSDQLACEKFGRQDFKYQNWRWQPHQCNLPRFNATALLERLRGKRLVFVGDSLNRGQWVSMVCLLDAVIPSSLKSMYTNGSLSSFRALVGLV
ncbi:hypothetical protein ACLOJK_025360 [Asimina triloba]